MIEDVKVRTIFDLSFDNQTILIEEFPDGSGSVPLRISSTGLKSTLEDQLAQEPGDWDSYDGAIDGLESLLLALAYEGILASDNQDAFKRAVQSALESITNNLAP